MKQSVLKQSLVWLRVCTVAFLLSIISLFLFSFSSNRFAGDVWQQLGMPQDQATERIKKTFVNGYFDTYGIRNIKELAAANRTSIARDLLGYTKQYLMSPAFQTEYNKARNDARPAASVSSARTKESIQKERIEDAEKTIVKFQDMKKTLGADMQKSMDEAIQGQRDLIKDYRDPNGLMVEAIYQQELAKNEQEQKHNQEIVKFWNDNYPADYRQFIRNRLDRYLKLASTVDFSAELTEKYHKKVFVNPVYQSKPNDWKMIYRAGKDVYELTRSFAEQWNKELQ